MSLIRLSLNDYSDFIKQLSKKNKDFSVIETSYTKRIKIAKNTVLFSDSPISPIELKLIQKIRTNADLFEHSEILEGRPQIDFYKFYDFRDNNKINGIKIDLNQAYWQAASNLGLITPEIQYYFEDSKAKLAKYYKAANPDKCIKLARLRTLGALATKKVVKSYKNGKLDSEKLVINEPHRQLYLYLCEKVAEVMSELAYEFHRFVIYYYWDCIFLSEDVNLKEVNNKIKSLGYNSKIDGQGEFEVIKGSYVSYLHDLTKNIKYPIMNDHLIK